MLDPLAACVEFLGLFGNDLPMGIEFGLERVKLVLLSCQFLLMGADQCYQCVPIEHVQIRKRCAIHGRSMPSLWTQCTEENPHQHRGIMMIIRPRLRASTYVRLFASRYPPEA